MYTKIICQNHLWMVYMYTLQLLILQIVINEMDAVALDSSSGILAYT